MSGGLDHPLDDFGARGLAVFQMTLPSNVPPPSLPGQINFLWRPCVADVDGDNVLDFRGQYAQENAAFRRKNAENAPQVAKLQWVTRPTWEIHRGPSVVPPGHCRLGTLRARQERRILQALTTDEHFHHWPEGALRREITFSSTFWI